MKIRPANSSDCKDLFEWRNDTFARFNSLQSEELQFEDHCNWFKAKMKSSKDHIFIASAFGQKIGQCRFDELCAHSFRVSILLNPKMRGKKLSKAVLIHSIEKFAQNQPKNLFAEVKTTNTASIRIFTELGFVKYNERDSILYFVLNTSQFKK